VGKWHDFFASEVGASAAPAGLLFVATSINLPRILQARYLVALAGQTLMILTGALCISSLALFPDVDSPRIMWAMAAAAFFAWLIVTLLLGTLRLLPPPLRSVHRFASAIILSQCATLPVLVAAFIGAIGGTLSPDAIAFGVIVAQVASLYSAWILLVEILH
jgi:hypothetical protein